MGSGCGSVGRAVACNIKGPWFDSSHWQNFIEHLFVNLFIINCIEKTKINKEAGNGPLFKKKSLPGILGELSITILGHLSYLSSPEIAEKARLISSGK